MIKPGKMYLTNIVKALIPGFFVLFICSCQNDLKKIELITSDAQLPTEIVENVDITYTDSGRLKAIVHTVLAKHFVEKNDPYLEMPKGVKADFYAPDGTIESNLEANYAINYEKRKMIELKDSVYVVNIEGETLETDKLIWDQNEQKIHTDAPVKITQKDQIIYGEGFESNQNFTQYTVYKIKGIVNLNEPTEDN